MEASEVRRVILGEPASKANQRRLVTFGRKKPCPLCGGRGGQPRLIKSEKALAYEKALQLQVRKLAEPLQGDLAVSALIFYKTRRPDLDASLILDGLEGRVYENDRQVRELHLYHALDRQDPRALVLVRPRSDDLGALLASHGPSRFTIEDFAAWEGGMGGAAREDRDPR